MIDVGDTSPLHYLIVIGHADVLPKFYGTGLYASHWFVPQILGNLARLTFEFGAPDRFEVRSTAVGLNIVF